MKAPGSPIKMSATPPDVRRPAPLLGEHTKDVLLETGFSEEEIGRLIENGVVGRTA
jgi:crotonobetainyl-CoA:carnitine CoA-transferase CaiB-like acyl-CoA transferase